ncbi:MAG: ATP-dependent DNA helicase RecQ [Planctomycetes bacterium]|nr:ATP-dependent DNA helicase RecQ [Planctomycetota bacterium]
MHRAEPAPPAHAAATAGILRRAGAILEEVFGFDDFRPGQRRAIEAVAAGRDCLVVMPTGSGKSLCYQVPALAGAGTTLVVSPLIALMKDQVDALRLRGAPATFINSSLTAGELSRRLDSLRAGEIRLLYVAPERFRSGQFRRALSALNVSLLAIDEAHCISEWGHDFRPDYRRLREVRDSLGGVCTIALTATATPDVQEDIVRELGMKDPERIVTGFDRPNLRYRVIPASGQRRKLEALRRVVLEIIARSGRDGPPAGIVYTGTRRHAEAVADFLRELAAEADVDASAAFCRAYHAGLEDDERRRVQEDFMEGRLACVAATNAFGMGVDKADIRFVIHFSLPGNVESYYQEVGRAGRDGLPAECVLLFAEKDRRLQDFFIHCSHPSRETIERVHDALWSLGESPILRPLSDLTALLESRGALPRRGGMTTLRSALAILERAGALEQVDHHSDLARIAPGPRTAGIAALPAAEESSLAAVGAALERLFAEPSGAAASVHVPSWAEEMGLSPHLVHRALSFLAEEGRISYAASFRGRAIVLPPARRPLAVDFEALRERRRRDEVRLQQMVALARSFRCRRSAILEYFGEEIVEESCGNCDRCRSGLARSGEASRAMSDREITVLRKILSGVARARGICGKGRIVQMLIGSRARAMTESGLDRLSTYGLLKDMGRREVGEIIDQLEMVGCLRREGGLRPVLQLTALGVRVMKAEERIGIEFPRAPSLESLPAAAASRGETSGDGGEGAAQEPSEEDEELFQRLRTIRRRIAGELGVPAYRVFNDRALRSMAQLRPASDEEMREVPGVGDVTLKRFGAPFLEEIRRAAM